MIALAAGIWAARRRLGPAHVYLLAYGAILAIWPYGDARFLLPVIPLLTAVFVEGIAPLMARRWARGLAWGAGVWCALLGGAAMAFSIRITLSGDNFPSAYGAGQYSNSYRAAFDQPINMASEFGIIPEVVEVLRRYDPRARRVWERMEKMRLEIERQAGVGMPVMPK